MLPSWNIVVWNWVHLFETPCIHLYTYVHLLVLISYIIDQCTVMDHSKLFIDITFSWDVTICLWGFSSWGFEALKCLHLQDQAKSWRFYVSYSLHLQGIAFQECARQLNPDDEGIKNLRNVGSNSLIYTSSQPEYPAMSRWEVVISQFRYRHECERCIWGMRIDKRKTELVLDHSQWQFCILPALRFCIMPQQ